MDPPPVSSSSFSEAMSGQTSAPTRSQSFSQRSDDSHTAAEFIDSQLQLEADAREALPYKFESCTKELGQLRQVLFSCLTCNPPPTNPSDSYTAAGVCYSCSIQCHGEHTLVELFNKRNFVCDCGTTRLPTTSPCTLRINPETNTKGGVHSEEPSSINKYNKNFKNLFCGCDCDYDPEQQKGTMFQCLGLGTAETGGCGEDWWHPGCVVGLGPNWFEMSDHKAMPAKPKGDVVLESISEVAETPEHISGGHTRPGGQDEVAHESNTVSASVGQELEEEDLPLPPGFPDEEDFEGFICFKCVDANPWIKRYAGAPGFLPPVFRRSAAPSPETEILAKNQDLTSNLQYLKKRKADDDDESICSGTSKRLKDEASTVNGKPTSLGVDITGATSTNPTDTSSEASAHCKVKSLPPAPVGQISLFFKSDFRDHLCRCPDCFPALKEHAQLLEEETIHEPSLSGSDDEVGSTVGSGSIYDRGESALKNVDRVRAIEGVMAYNHLKDKLKPFFQQFAESGKAISAEDIKAHFAKMRGDEQAIREAGEGAKSADTRKEQDGY